MKKLIKQTAQQLGKVDGKKETNKNQLSYTDFVDLLQQLEEMKNYNVAIKNDDGILKLTVGDSVYKISKIDHGYPKRRLTKLEV